MSSAAAFDFAEPIDADGPEPVTVTPQPEPFSFTGSGGEYFRIWIVNLLLTIVTLGIYSAWAKVRKTRYFYDSTTLAGASFDYHGSPMAILKGRIVAVLLFAAYNVFWKISSALGFAMLGVMMAVGPWLVWKSLQFKLANSSYRGIRFGFGGSAGKAYTAFLLHPLLAVCSAYLLAPLAHQRFKKFQHEESRFGDRRFSFGGKVRGFYKAYCVFILVALAGMLAIGFAFGFGGAIASLIKTGSPARPGVFAGTIGLFLLAVTVWLFSLFPLFQTMLQNLVWNNTSLGEHQFCSALKPGRMVVITLTNLLGIMATLGLFIPFAQVRMMKYRIESMTLLPAGGLDDFMADVQEQASAFGEGMADLLDFDLSL